MPSRSGLLLLLGPEANQPIRLLLGLRLHDKDHKVRGVEAHGAGVAHLSRGHSMAELRALYHISSNLLEVAGHLLAITRPQAMAIAKTSTKTLAKKSETKLRSRSHGREGRRSHC